MTAHPADVELAFESRRKARATFHRWGLPELLLQGRSLETFYAALLRARGASVRQIGGATYNGLEGVKASFSQTGEHQLDRFMGRAWTNGEGLLWHDREEKRLYAFEQIGPRGVPLLSSKNVFARPSP